MTPFMTVSMTILCLGVLTGIAAIIMDYCFGREIGMLAGLVMLVGLVLGGVGLILWIVSVILVLF